MTSRYVSLILFGLAVVFILGSRPEAPAYTPQNQSTVAVGVPFYAATYGEPGGFSKADARRVLELLESMDKRLDSIDQKTGTGGPLSVKKGLDLLTVAKSRCLNCHTESKAESKGGGFILFSDETGSALKPLSSREKVRIKEAVQSGTMPPNKKLDAEERSAFSW